jgi:hypothetical protein
VSSPRAAGAGRDPRRSLIVGTIIAAVVLALLALIVLVGIVLVFVPRRSGRDALGWSDPGPPPVAIHLPPVAAS